MTPKQECTLYNCQCAVPEVTEIGKPSICVQSVRDREYSQFEIYSNLHDSLRSYVQQTLGIEIPSLRKKETFYLSNRTCLRIWKAINSETHKQIGSKIAHIAGVQNLELYTIYMQDIFTDIFRRSGGIRLHNIYSAMAHTGEWHIYARTAHENEPHEHIAGSHTGMEK